MLTITAYASWHVALPLHQTAKFEPLELVLELVLVLELELELELVLELVLHTLVAQVAQVVPALGTSAVQVARAAQTVPVSRLLR